MMTFAKILGDISTCPPSSTFEGDRPLLSRPKSPPLYSTFLPLPTFHSHLGLRPGHRQLFLEKASWTAGLRLFTGQMIFLTPNKQYQSTHSFGIMNTPAIHISCYAISGEETVILMALSYSLSIHRPTTAMCTLVYWPVSMTTCISWCQNVKPFWVCCSKR